MVLHPRELDQIVVDRLQLMQRINARDRETEVRVELIGDVQGVGLKSEMERSAVAFEGVLRFQNGEAS